MSLASVIQTLKENFGWSDDDIKRRESSLWLIYIMAMDEKVLAGELDKIVLQKENIEEFLKSNPFAI